MKLSNFILIVLGCIRKGFFINPFLLYSQSYHETGGFTSAIYGNKNLFGMKHPSKRETTSKGVKNGHAYYDSKFDSVIDYILRQREFNIKPQIFNNEKYMIDTFNSAYAEDTQYVAKWTKLNNDLTSKNLVTFSLLLVIPFASFLFIIYKIIKSKL